MKIINIKIPNIKIPNIKIPNIKIANKKSAFLALLCSLACIAVTRIQAQQTQVQQAPVPEHRTHDLSIYPTVRAELNRHVIWLDPQQDEQQLKVEIVATKQHMKDCNRGSFSADFSQKYLKDGSHAYYQIGPADRYISTLMGCPHVRYLGDSPVRFSGESMLPYYSHAPIIVYAPQEIQVSYRIWQIASTHPANIENENKIIQRDQ